MKFVHIADIHFDSPFVNLSDKESLGDLRRLEQRKALKKVIEYIKENEIEFLFISGDMYEQKYIKKSTIEYINNLFKEIPKTKIFITPGNHDPLIKNSYYNKYIWNSNVKIFGNNLEKVSCGNIDIYGYGFNDFYFKGINLENINIENKDKINILITHGSLDSSTEYQKVYNPIKKTVLKEIGFDYVALGHIHKLDYNTEENQRIVYPGSLLSLGFDELDKHGMVVGNIEKEGISVQFVPIDEKEFKLFEIDVTSFNYIEELIENINGLSFEANVFVEVVLVGKRNFEIDVYGLCKLLVNRQVIKLKDNTKLSYDLERLQNETTLKGIFARLMLERLRSNDVSVMEREGIERALEIGFESLE